jgi:hypothetical protein
MKKLLTLGVAGVLFFGAILAQAQTVTVDNNPAQNLLVDPNQSAVSIDPATGNAFVRTAVIIGGSVASFSQPTNVAGGTVTLAPGASFTVSWSSTNNSGVTTPCTPSGQWASSGALANIGTLTLNAPTAANTYQYGIACRNTAGVTGNTVFFNVTVSSGGGGVDCSGVTPPPNLTRQAFPQTWEDWSTCTLSTSCNGPVLHYPVINNVAIFTSSPGNYIAMQFNTGNNPGGTPTNNPPNFGKFSFVSEGAVAGIWRVTLSKCPGDFRLPTDAGPNPPLAECVANEAGEATIIYSLTTFGIGCRILEPNSTYYLNLTLGTAGGGPGLLSCPNAVCKLRGIHGQNTTR